MNLIIITCPRLAKARLSKQVAQVNEAITVGLISDIHVICMNDSDARSLTKIPYKPEEWGNDIGKGWQFFKANIINQLKKNEIDVKASNSLTYSLNSNACFPERTLTESEHSIALRHMLALEAIAAAKSPCIVLEDDALVQDQLLFHELLKLLRASMKDRLFYDLADGYIPLDAKSSKFYLNGRFQYCSKPVAVTRTLMAYAMTPRTASLLFSSLTHYSLPIDMQFQVILNSLCVPGLSLVNTPFVHGSKSNAMASAIKQH
jgi:hypothetical protein